MQFLDKNIRSLLLERLQSQVNKPKKIIEELSVHNGNAIADVVAIYKEAHCYEIKSDRDKVERAVKQSEFYDASFRKITLVTTMRHIEKASLIIPSYWGIMAAVSGKEKNFLKHIRPAKNNPLYNKQKALMMLWKKELLSMSKDLEFDAKQSRAKIAAAISSCLGKNQVNLELSKLLVSRKGTKYSLPSYK